MDVSTIPFTLLNIFNIPYSSEIGTFFSFMVVFGLIVVLLWYFKEEKFQKSWDDLDTIGKSFIILLLGGVTFLFLIGINAIILFSIGIFWALKSPYTIGGLGDWFYPLFILSSLISLIYLYKKLEKPLGVKLVKEIFNPYLVKAGGIMTLVLIIFATIMYLTGRVGS